MINVRITSERIECLGSWYPPSTYSLPKVYIDFSIHASSSKGFCVWEHISDIIKTIVGIALTSVSFRIFLVKETTCLRNVFFTSNWRVLLEDGNGDIISFLLFDSLSFQCLYSWPCSYYFELAGYRTRYSALNVLVWLLDHSFMRRAFM